MKKTLDQDEEDLKHLELINAQSKSKYEDLSSNYESLANSQKVIMKNLTAAQTNLHNAQEEMNKKTRVM